MRAQNPLFRPLQLPCGVRLRNRIVKAAMSDSLGDGTGHPTPQQNRLYRRWADGGAAALIIGEVQGTADFAETPGNLVLNAASEPQRFRELARSVHATGAALWLQLGHAGALAYGPTSAPKGPSALALPALQCGALTAAEIADRPAAFAATARLAKAYGFGGVEIHAAHGFLLSQFLSPLFNRRTDEYGGPLENRMRLLIASVAATRAAVGPKFPIAVKLNSSDQLEGGLTEADALQVVAALDRSSVDLIDISGGTYFPGAKAASDGGGSGPYFIEFAKRARKITEKPLMLTGGIKTHQQAADAIAGGAVDCVGLARAMVLEPSLPSLWERGRVLEPEFPRFAAAPEGGITAWYTMRLTDIGSDADRAEIRPIGEALAAYAARDRARTDAWLQHFGTPA